jgi:hypothetical protein
MLTDKKYAILAHNDLKKTDFYIKFVDPLLAKISIADPEEAEEPEDMGEEGSQRMPYDAVSAARSVRAKVLQKDACLETSWTGDSAGEDCVHFAYMDANVHFYSQFSAAFADEVCTRAVRVWVVFPFCHITQCVIERILMYYARNAT